MEKLEFGIKGNNGFNMNKQSIIIGAFLVVISIVLGAFGAHALKQHLSPEKLISFETGVRYQMYHGLAFILIGIIEGKYLVSIWSRRALFVGVMLFSGSIYILSLQELIGIELKFLGPITPIGGLLMILGWGLMIKNLLDHKA